MKRRGPNKLKAALICALIAVPVSVVTIAAVVWGGFLVVDTLGGWDVTSAPLGAVSWLFPILVYGSAPVLAVVLSFLIVVDHVPFGRYRLRLIPKDDPRPHLFD